MQFGGQPTPWSETEIEGLRLRSVSQILIQEIGADGPENAEDSARRACGVIQRQADQIVSADARIAELETAIKRQAAAVRMLDMSHVARAETMMQHAQVLRDQSNTAALESERAANALLTERIAELERECQQWRLELRIYRETENKRIAELEQSVTVRDTEIARLETDLELARRDAERINRLSAHLADDITICPPGKHGKGDGWLIFWQTGWDNYGQIGEETHGATLRDAIDAARAGNGGGV